MASPVENGESSKAILTQETAPADALAGAVAAVLNEEAPSSTTHNYVATDNNIVLATDKKSPNKWQLTRREAMKAAGAAAVWKSMILPCVTYGQTQYDLQQIKKIREEPDHELIPYKKINGPCVGYGVLAAIPPLAGILAIKETNRIRGEYDIEPRKNDNSTTVFCPHCTVLRDNLEVGQRENERAASVVKQQPPPSLPMLEISPHPEELTPPMDDGLVKAKKPKRKGKAILHPSEILHHHPEALDHLKRPLSRILERRSETTQDSHLTGSTAEMIGMPPLPTLGADTEQEAEEPVSRLPTPLPRGLQDEPLPEPALSPYIMPMDQIIVRIRTPSPSRSIDTERMAPPARGRSPVHGSRSQQHSPVRSPSPAPGRRGGSRNSIGPALLPHEVHSAAGNALSVDDPLNRRLGFRADNSHRLHDDWIQESEVTPGLGPGYHNLEIDITLPTIVTPLTHHMPEDQAVNGHGRARSPAEMIAELPLDTTPEPETPKTGDVRQTPQLVSIQEGHKPTIVDINKRSSPPHSPPMPGIENTGGVGADPTPSSPPPDTDKHTEEEFRGPIGIPKTVTAPNPGAGSTRSATQQDRGLNFLAGLLGRSHTNGDGANSRPTSPSQSRIPVPVSRRRLKEGRRSSKESSPSRKVSPAWDKPTVVEHTKRMGSYQLMMRDGGTGRLSGLEI